MIDAALTNHGNAIAALADQLRARQLSLTEWERRMRVEVKSIHLYSAMAAKGGRAQLTAQDFGRIGAAVKRQYRYLSRFANEIATGQQPLDGRAVRRSKMYAQAGRGSYEATRERLLASKGFDLERNVLNPAAEHCVGDNSCDEQTKLGWVKRGTLVKINARRCLTECHCQIERKNSQTGEIAA